MWWQIRRVGLFVLLIDALAIAVAAAACMILATITKVNLATVLLGIAVLLAFSAAGFGDGPARMPISLMARDRGALYENQLRVELEQGQDQATGWSKQMVRNGPAWPLGLGVAAIPFVALSAILAGA